MNYGVLSIKKTLSEEDWEREYGAGRIWTAFDPNSYLIVCHYVGDRTLKNCSACFRTFLNRLDGIPLHVGDELICYKTLLQESYSREVPTVPAGKRGCPDCPKQYRIRNRMMLQDTRPEQIAK
jgi:hypothetical protein